ncbi:MAG TPA: MFS transporter, partial [Chloroflexota bacterium]
MSVVTTSTPAETTAEAAAVTPLESKQVLWLTNASHLVNHMLGQMPAVLYPAMMGDLGFGVAELGLLVAIQNLVGNAAEVIWGFLTPFLRRTYVLAFGNVVMSIGTALTSLVGSFPALVVTRTTYSVGASVQHPIGSSLLSGYFPRRRGSVLALNSSIAAVGSLVAAPLAALLLAVYGWRAAFVLGALAGMVMAVGYLLRPDRRAPVPAGSRRRLLAEGGASYRRVLRNRNLIVISVVMMLGAAGRTGGVNQAYLGVHFQEDLGMSLAAMGIALAVVQLGSIFGPVGFGWLSDRTSRKRVMQASLLLSALATWWLAIQTGERLPFLIVNLLVYGATTYSRNTLTQAVVADSANDKDRDAAFSMYFFVGFISAPIWTLIAGLLMDRYGFGLAFSVLGFSYIAGMLVLTLLTEP